MSIAVLDSQTDSHARARAQAAAIADAPRVTRRYVASSAVLRPSPRLRQSARRARSPAASASGSKARHTRRWVAAGVLVVEVAALVLLLTLPGFRVRTVTVTGNRLVSAAMLMRTAAVPATSIFTVDGDAVRARLLSLPWLQDATVTTDLPGTVHITVVERSPVLRIRRPGSDMLVAADGAILPASAAPPPVVSSVPVLVDDRIGSPGPIDTTLLQMLSTTAQRFQSVFGCSVAAFQWGADDVFAIWASTGWRAVLGHLDTDSAVARIPAQLAALAALKGKVDFTHPNFGYIDLDDLAAPVAGGVAGLPTEIASAATASSPASPGSAVAPPVSTPTPRSSASPSTSPSATPTPPGTGT